ncbi:AMP-binding protein, partial [[Kitasatospora] papulosa]
GAGYVPIDPRYPSARLDHVVSDASPRLLLTDGATAEVLPGAGVPRLLMDGLDLSVGDGSDLSDGERLGVLRPQNTAYVMYTSGSTGVPKGVTITHHCVMSDARALAAAVGLTSSSRMLFATSINFDVSAFEIFSALGAGACVEVVRDALELIERGGWTGSVISAVPSVLA